MAYVEKRSFADIGSKRWKEHDLKVINKRDSIRVLDVPSKIWIEQYHVPGEQRGKVKRWLTAELAARVRGFCLHDLPPPEEHDDE